jgi:murein DD-endopeptidase MepM/ murein hydrolase activator NlpD
MISNGPGEGYHTGVDAEAIDYVPMDTWLSNGNVRAAHAGTVKYASYHSCAGNIVGIQQSDGKASLYYHLKDNSILVKVNDSVSKGKLIADFGNTGSCSDGAHLHFTARSSVTWSNPTGSGTSINVRDLRGTGWYAWWPLDSHFSGYIVQSTSHSGSCSYDRTIDVRWPAASSVVGGYDIDGYSWQWSTSSSTTPDTTKDGEETVSTSTSSSLAKGDWYFHLRVKDNVGGWASSSEVAHLGPFCICTTSCPKSSDE